jgi:hypothetical protein
MEVGIRRIFEAARSWLRPMFHWVYSGVAIPTFWTAGITLTLADKFGLAYFFFAICGVWSLVYWLTSNYLVKRRARLKNRAIRRDEALLVIEARKYWMTEWGVSVVIMALTLGHIYWSSIIKRDIELDDVFQHLTVNHYIDSGDDDPTNTVFTVTNGGSYEISPNRAIACETRLAIGNDGTSAVIGSPPIANTENGASGDILWDGRNHKSKSSTLRPGGDAESGQCLKWIHFKGKTDCIDTTVTFFYALTNWPDISKQKSFRYVGYNGKDGQFSWIQQAVGSTEQYCKKFDKGTATLP